MATESLASFENFLKILFVEDNITDALSNNLVLYGEMRRRGQIKKFEGREIRFPVQTQRQAGVGWTPNNTQSLPAATVSTAIEPVWNARNMYAVGEINDEVIEDSMTSRASYERALELTRDDLMLSQKQMIQASMYDDGRARLSVFPGASDANPIVVSQPLQVWQGQNFDVVDLSDNQTKLLDGVPATGVDHAADTIAYTGTTISGSAAGDYVTAAGTIGATGEQYATFGLRAGCTAGNPPLGNYGSVDRTTVGNEAWQGNEFANGGTNRPVNELLIANAINQVRRRSNTVLNDMALWTNHNILTQYWQELVKDRIVSLSGKEAMDLAGGYKNQSNESGTVFGRFNGVIPIYADEFSPANTIFMLNMPSWRIYQTHDPELITRDGNVLHRFIDRGAYQFRSLWRAEFFTIMPSANGIILDVAES